jgi:SpoVK/Ycf46/Vps4 family AAA+-type ATPase
MRKTTQKTNNPNVYVKEIEENMLDTGNKVSFNDIAGLDHVKQVLNEAIIYPALRPDIYKGIRAPPKGILFYGPPGNGKTMLAKAVATESDCTFFNVSAGTLISKWVGDSERMLNCLSVLNSANRA